MNDDIEIKAVGTTTETEKPSIRWIFKDSRFLPLEKVVYLGKAAIKSTTGESIPAFIFGSDYDRYSLSEWGKPNIPLPLMPMDVARIYFDREKKQVCVLKLN